MKKKKINIISHDNGVGLSQDISILMTLLDEYDVKFFDPREHQVRNADINMFLEITDKRLLKKAGVNILIPNPEWHFDVPIIKMMDLVFAKTRDCEKIFKRLGGEVIFTSFTSVDRYQRNMTKEKVFLHTAGRSETKGSDEVWKAFNAQDMPELIFLKYHNHERFMNHGFNITPCFTRLDLDTLITLQNKCFFHLCPSQYEGFGHYIWEGKSAGGIIITTSAPPMNEMVDSSNGKLVKTISKRRMNQAIIHRPYWHDIQKICRSLNQYNEKTLLDMSENSRQSFVDNDRWFRENMLNIFKNL